MAVFIYLKNNSRFSQSARDMWVANNRAKAEDFIIVEKDWVAPEPVVAPLPVPEGTIIIYQLPSGLQLTPEALSNYLARGLCRSEDVVLVNTSGPAASSEAVASQPESEAKTVLPLDTDGYTKAELVSLAEALALATDGSKAILVARINDLGDEAGTAAAIQSIRG